MKEQMMMKEQLITERSALEDFGDVTEDDIIHLWQSFQSVGLTGDAAWNAIVTGIALDMAFNRTRNLSQIEH